MGMFDEFTRLHGDRRLLARELALRCPNPVCRVTNAPGRTLIELETEARAVCSVCARAFNPEEQEHRS